MAEINLPFILMVFGVAFLVVFLTRKAIRKVNKDRASKEATSQKLKPATQSKLTEDQFNRIWKNLSYLILLAGAGNLYMVYTAVNAALVSGIVFFWIDAFFSLAAAISAFFLWKLRRKLWVFIYFTCSLIPVFLFMSFKGPGFKESALIHLFPLVLLYFVLKPVWNNLDE
jgi:hypothetical protein